MGAFDSDGHEEKGREIGLLTVASNSSVAADVSSGVAGVDRMIAGGLRPVSLDRGQSPTNPLRFQIEPEPEPELEPKPDDETIVPQP